MIVHIDIEKDGAGNESYLIRFYEKMEDLVDPNRKSYDLYECTQAICSKDALAEFNKVAEVEQLHDSILKGESI
jgi:hypothetical protein